MTWIFSERAPAGLVSVGLAYRMAARRLIPNERFVKVIRAIALHSDSSNELRILAARGTKHRKSRKFVPPRQNPGLKPERS